MASKTNKAQRPVAVAKTVAGDNGKSLEAKLARLAMLDRVFAIARATTCRPTPRPRSSARSRTGGNFDGV